MGHRLNGNGNGKSAVNIVRCSGNLDATKMVQMKSRFNRLLNQNRRFFLLDLKEAQHADLAGLGILVDRLQKIRSLKGDIRLFNIRPEVSHILQIVGLNQIIGTYANEEEAVRSFQVA